ncbi:hypothetical protein ScPMuIL_007914 [Solemya velum]
MATTVSTKMYKYSNADYSLRDFHSQFRMKLPQLVAVKQGFCGEKEVDSLSAGQMIFIHAVHTQLRVVAQESEKNDDRLVSFPVDFPVDFCVVHDGSRIGSPQSLQKILEENTLPIEVQFVGEETVTFYGHRFKDNIRKLRLLHTFENKYFLANEIQQDTGDLEQQTISIPLYLPMVLLVRVNGLSNQPTCKWKDYVFHMHKCARRITNDTSILGNPDVAIYSKFDIPNTDDSAYACLEPLYFTRPQYMSLADTSRHNEQEYKQCVSVDVSDGTRKNFTGDLKCLRPKNNFTREHRFKKNSSILPIQVLPSEPVVPPVPPRLYRTDLAKTHAIEKQYNTEMPTNDCRATPPGPTFANIPISLNTKSTNVNDGEDTKRSSQLKNMSVEDVVNVLEKLNLTQYSDSFRSNLIDGVILSVLDHDLLIKDLGFRGIDAIRLLKYVDSGHLPKLDKDIDTIVGESSAGNDSDMNEEFL